MDLDYDIVIDDWFEGLYWYLGDAVHIPKLVGESGNCIENMEIGFESDNPFFTSDQEFASGDYIIEFNPFGYSLYDESVKNISEKQYIKRFYKLVQELQKAGAVITVFDEDGESGDILFLKRELDMCLCIIAETKRYPD